MIKKYIKFFLIDKYSENYNFQNIVIDYENFNSIVKYLKYYILNDLILFQKVWFFENNNCIGVYKLNNISNKYEYIQYNKLNLKNVNYTPINSKYFWNLVYIFLHIRTGSSYGKINFSYGKSKTSWIMFLEFINENLNEILYYVKNQNFINDNFYELFISKLSKEVQDNLIKIGSQWNRNNIISKFYCFKTYKNKTSQIWVSASKINHLPSYDENNMFGKNEHICVLPNNILYLDCNAFKCGDPCEILVNSSDLYQI